MPCSADRYAATRPAGWPATVKLCTATRSALSGQIPSRVTPGTVARPAASRSSRTRSWAGPGPSSTGASVRQAWASAAAPSTFGVPASCRCGAGAQVASSTVDPGHGAAAGEVGRARRRASRGARPAPPRRRARRACARTAPRSRRRSRRGRPGGAGRAVRRRRPRGRPRRARSRRSASSGSTSPVTLDAPVTASSAVGSARAARRSRSVRVSRDGRGRPAARGAAAPRQGSRLAWCSTSRHEHRARGHAPGQQVQRVRGVAGEDDDVVGPGPDELADASSRARSSSAVLTCER